MYFKKLKNLNVIFCEHILKRPAMLAVAINIGYFYIYYISYSQIFETSDDATMMRIASGDRFGSPNEYLIVINVIIGIILKNLFSSLPTINWYVLLFWLLHFIAMTVILYLILLNKNNLFSLVLYTFVFVFAEIPLLTNLQFTSTAFVTGVSGILLIYNYHMMEYYNKWLNIILGVFLLVMAGLIRDNIFLLLLFLWLPVLAIDCYLVRNYSRLFIVLIASIFFVCFLFYDKAYYEKDIDWKIYMEYKPLRGQLTDYPYYEWNENTKDVYSQVGWSENDVMMFRSWSFADTDIFNIEDLEYIVENISPVKREVNDLFKTMYESFSRIGIYNIIMCSFICIFALIFTEKSKRIIIMLSLIMFLVTTVYFSFLGRLPFRLLYPMISNIMLVSVLLIIRSDVLISSWISLSSRRYLFYKISISILAFISIFNFALEAVNSKDNVLFQDKINQRDEILASYNYTYISWGGILNYNKSLVTLLKMDERPIRVVDSGGWLVPSPLHLNNMALHSIDNIYLDLLNRSDLLLVAKPYHIELLETFYLEHYETQIGYYAYIVIDANLFAYKIFDLSAAKDYSKTSITEKLEKPTLRYPDPGVIEPIACKRITLEWDKAKGAIRYQYRVIRASDNFIFDEGFVDGFKTQVIITGLPVDGTEFQWAIRAGDASGNWSDWNLSRFISINKSSRFDTN